MSEQSKIKPLQPSTAERCKACGGTLAFVEAKKSDQKFICDGKPFRATVLAFACEACGSRRSYLSEVTSS